MRLRTSLKISIAGLLYGLFCHSSFAVEMSDLLPYRGVYDIQLENASDKAGISSLSGRMVYEFSGSKCSGYTTRFRFVTQVYMDEMSSRVSDMQTTTYESTDGKEFRFASKSYADRELTKELSGTAKHIDNKIQVAISNPKKEDFVLEKADFPTTHTLEVLNHALSGKRFFKAALFDGSDDADQLTDTTVVIGELRAGGVDSETKVMGDIGKQDVWPVTISYFDDDKNKEGLPSYRTSFLLYKNGITRDLMMDYGDFSVRARLVRLDVFDKTKTDEECSK